MKTTKEIADMIFDGKEIEDIEDFEGVEITRIVHKDKSQFSHLKRDQTSGRKVDVELVKQYFVGHPPLKTQMLLGINQLTWC